MHSNHGAEKSLDGTLWNKNEIQNEAVLNCLLCPTVLLSTLSSFNSSHAVFTDFNWYLSVYSFSCASTTVCARVCYIRIR